METKETSLRYYYDGHTQVPIKPGKAHEKLLGLLRELDQKPLKSGFRWNEEFKFTKDVRPDVHLYDEVFLDLLFEQGIPQKLREITNQELVLFGTCLRKAYPGAIYMGWHRDTYLYRNRPPAGLIPAVHKLMFYPSLGEKPTVQLKILPSSHMGFFKYKYVDRLQTLVLPSQDILSSDSNLLLFNSALYHSTTPISRQNGSFRLMYYFCNKVQYEKAYDDALHKNYGARLLNWNSGTNQPRLTQ